MSFRGGQRKTARILRFGPGQTFYESPNDIHTIGRNPSKTTLIKFLVFLIKGKVAPVSIPVE